MLAHTVTLADIRLTATASVALLVLASVVAIAVSRLRLPYTVALVVVGLGVGLTGWFSDASVTKDLILLVFLPPLLFEAAINMDLRELARRWSQVAVLAVAGTLVSAACVALPLVVAPGMGLRPAVLLAVVLAATDPVSVLAIMKDVGASGGLRTLLEGESIFNDAFAIVLYGIAVDWALTASGTSAWRGLGDLGQQLAVGTAAGVAVGLAAHRLMSTLDDHLVEITLSVATAYGAFLLADRLGGSGVMATVGAGLLIGNYGPGRAMSSESRDLTLAFWEVVAFLANSAIFLLIGLRFRGSDLNDTRTVVAVATAVVGILVGRAVIAYVLLAPLARRPEIPRRWRPAILWGGLRGSIPIALVLGLPARSVGDVDSTGVVFAVVIVSVIAQGATYRPLLDRLGLNSAAPEPGDGPATQSG